MHIAMMTAWNTDSGVAVHAEPLGKAWKKMGHDVTIFTHTLDDFHGKGLTREEDENYVIRCLGTQKTNFLDPRPVFTTDFDVLVVQDLRMLPVKSLAEIFPLIKRKIPSVIFVIAGKSPSPDVQALHNGKNVFVIGYVADAINVMGENALFVVPMRLGGGTRIKILEAMAIGKTVVSTTIGCEGIDATNGENIAITDKPQDFADKCIELLNNSTKRDEIGNSAKKFVEENYAWQKIGEKYSNYLRTMLTNRFKREHEPTFRGDR